MNLDLALAQLAAPPDLATPGPGDHSAARLAELALHLAAEEFPGLSVPEYLAKLDELAAGVAPRLTGDLERRVATLSEYLFEETGFLGNAPRYYDPANSYLNCVLDRKLGIPITLSLVAMAVGERCGLTVVGVGLPGHFVAKAIEGRREVMFDPFHGGQFLDLQACATLVEEVSGQSFVPTPEALSAVSAPQFVRRLLTNLKGNYTKQGDWPRAARVTGRLVQLAPDEPYQQRDYGVLLLRADRPSAAIRPLKFFLNRHPAGPDAEVVRTLLREAKAQVGQWN